MRMKCLQLKLSTRFIVYYFYFLIIKLLPCRKVTVGYNKVTSNLGEQHEGCILTQKIGTRFIDSANKFLRSYR